MTTVTRFSLVDTLLESKVATHDVGQQSRNMNPHSGWCLRCGMANVDHQKDHRVVYRDGSAMFPLCIDCWQQSTPDERFEYCKALFRSWLIGHLSAAWSANVRDVDSHPKWLSYMDRILEECSDDHAAT